MLVDLSVKHCCLFGNEALNETTLKKSKYLATEENLAWMGTRRLRASTAIQLAHRKQLVQLPPPVSSLPFALKYAAITVVATEADQSAPEIAGHPTVRHTDNNSNAKVDERDTCVMKRRGMKNDAVSLCALFVLQTLKGNWKGSSSLSGRRSLTG